MQTCQAVKRLWAKQNYLEETEIIPTEAERSLAAAGKEKRVTELPRKKQSSSELPGRASDQLSHQDRSFSNILSYLLNVLMLWFAGFCEMSLILGWALMTQLSLLALVSNPSPLLLKVCTIKFMVHQDGLFLVSTLWSAISSNLEHVHMCVTSPQEISVT